ncbi:hypothetical protein CDV36_015937 [Fusarium kuroshium]|uniref:Uncharacterized protein n=1 Tax=Fusarium kuroshium TaxID=2010991 RepID=A0A3M2R3E9_9HYPO|nr:hypothetical protein CDV36_015937 [Fusarium kuroshium]
MPSSTINEAIKQPIEDDVSRLNDFSVQERISAAYIGEAKEHLYRDGFFELDDSSIGDHISELQRRGFPFHSEWALDWTKSHILDDLAVREINKDILGDCSLVHLLPQQPYPGHIFRYVPVRSAPLFSHLVLLCSKGSRLRLRAGSPRHSLEGKLGRRSIYEIQAEVYDKAGCPAVLIEFPAGGK